MDAWNGQVLGRNTGEELDVDKAVRQLQHKKDMSRHKAKKTGGDANKGKRKPGKSPTPVKKQGRSMAVKKQPKAGGGRPKGGGKGKRR